MVLNSTGTQFDLFVTKSVMNLTFQHQDTGSVAPQMTSVTVGHEVKVEISGNGLPNRAPTGRKPDPSREIMFQFFRDSVICVCG